MEDLTTIIEDSIDDAKLADPSLGAESDDSPIETPETDLTPSSDVPAKVEAVVPDATADLLKSSSDVTDVDDDFAKKHGLAPQRPGERENRLPYSAVKRIVSNAERKALEPVQKRITEFETKVTDYETRLGRVAQFEQVMTSDPAQFLNMLSARIPGYKQLFDSMARQAQPAQAATPPNPNEGMPQPDVTLQDGSKVYSMEGLGALNKWNRDQAKKEIASEYDKRLAPFEQERAARMREAALIPQIDRQIAEARTWAQFKENEDAITAALRANPQLSLEGAYRQVVLPKLSTDYNSMRARVLSELKRAPAATSAGGAGAKPIAEVAGPRTPQQIIMDSIAGLNGR